MNNSKQNRTAILVFANSSSEEANRKSIENSNILFDRLNKLTLFTVSKTKLPYFRFTEKEQIGFSFEDRFINAIQSVFKKGFYNVVAIGNDTPQLRFSEILDAKEKIEQGKLVLGPSADGGFYLLGINQQMFSSIKMKGLSWETSRLFSEIRQESLFNNFEVATLKTYSDVDDLSDIKKLVNSYGLPPTILKLFLTTFVSSKRIETKITTFYKSATSNAHRNKGSPYLSFPLLHNLASSIS